MVGERLGDVEQDRLARGVGEVGVRGADAERRDDGVAGEVRVVDEEPRVGRVVRVEGEPEQPTLAAAGDRGLTMSRNGRATTVPSRTTWIRPACSTTKSRPLPSPALVTSTGDESPLTATWTSTVTPVGSNGPAAADADGAGDHEEPTGEATAEDRALGVGAIGGRDVGDGAGAHAARPMMSAAASAVTRDLDIAGC